MVLTGAGTGPMHYRWEDYYSPRQLCELAETGRLTEVRGEGLRRKIVIEAQTLEDFAAFDQAELLSAVACPVLLIHGDNDAEELELLKHSRRGLRYLADGSRLEVVRGATHSFFGYLESVIDLGCAWLAQYMPREGVGY